MRTHLVYAFLAITLTEHKTKCFTFICYLNHKMKSHNVSSDTDRSLWETLKLNTFPFLILMTIVADAIRISLLLTLLTVLGVQLVTVKYN